MAGFWSSILSGVRGGSAVFTPSVTHLGADEFRALLDPSSMSASQMWDTQPHFRTVVTFLARNIAQLGLHSFERVDNTDRQRDRSSVLARSLADVDGNMTTYELIFALVGDLALYDRAYWWSAPSADMPSGWMVRRLPPTWVEPVMGDAWSVKEYKLHLAGGKVERVPAESILAFTGYHPSRSLGSSPTVDALRETLQEQVEASKYRAQVWKRGGRVSSVIERPKDAPGWSDSAREAFRDDWYAKYTGKGSKAGGTPILEDGMKLTRIDFNARDQQFVEAAKLSLTTVASAFHVNPTMIGQNDGANYANVREFRKMLYGDTLGPLVAQIESRLNSFLVPRMGLDKSRFYVEFNIDEKLQGNFEEQAAVLQSATGGPWMTRNEARAMRNLPAVPGGDELIVPLNVIEGGQASPNDSGSQNVGKMGLLSVQRKALSEFEVKAPADTEVPEDEQRTVATVFVKHFERQRRAVLSAMGSKDASWWDGERWDDELSEDLLDVSLTVSERAALTALGGLGVAASAYSVERTEAFLKKVAQRIAGSVNLATLAALEDALANPDVEPSHVFDVAVDSRADMSGMTAAATFIGFGAIEAARQTKPKARKRWNTNSGNPRASHARLSGEEVGIDEEFSNGLLWPGSFSGDVEEVANCHCSITVTSG